MQKAVVSVPEGRGRSLWTRFWWPLSGNDDLGNSVGRTEDFGARLSGTTDEETWKSSSLAERYCVLNKDDDSRESLCESYSKGLGHSFFRGTDARVRSLGQSLWVNKASAIIWPII